MKTQLKELPTVGIKRIVLMIGWDRLLRRCRSSHRRAGVAEGTDKAPRQIAALECAPYKGQGMNGWKRWLPGLQMLEPVRSRLAAARSDGRPGADHDAGAGRNRLRRGVGRPGHLRPVRHHRPAARLRAVRPEPHSGAGAGFLARRGDSRGRAAALCAAIRCAPWPWRA